MDLGQSIGRKYMKSSINFINGDKYLSHPLRLDDILFTKRNNYATFYAPYN